MKKLDVQIVEPAYEITPLLVIFYSLGGYIAEKNGKQSLVKAKEIEKRLSNFLRERNLIITIDGNGRLIFSEQS